MPSLVRPRLRTTGAALVLAFAASACGDLSGGAGTPLPAPLAPGQPAGSVTAPAGGDPATAVQALQAAITADGGTVVATVDHAAVAQEVGVAIPPNTVVIGAPEAANLSMVQVTQTAAVNLPPPFQVRQDPAGATVLSWDSPDYLAAVSGVAPAPPTALVDAMTAIVSRVAPAAAAAEPAPLIGVTPVDYLLTVFGSTDVSEAVGLLQRGSNRAGNRFVAAVTFVPEPAPARGAAAAAPPPVPGARPTSTVLVSRPGAEAPLLAAAPSIGLDLPLRFVIWIDEQDRTVIGYPDIRRIAVRHGIPADDPNVVTLAAEADRLGRVAAGIAQ
ncbi:MAG TPA: DUF302 domain-containing protein [Pseudonocardia sp.]|jgi:uncharacterized protein (DUF302 family)|nr:DUF302 domain-containing protein [Pseudonocardia sp.]